MPRYTTPDGINVECSQEQAEFLGYGKASPAKKEPAKKSAQKVPPDPED